MLVLLVLLLSPLRLRLAGPAAATVTTMMVTMVVHVVGREEDERQLCRKG
jgi:hypothetical protein